MFDKRKGHRESDKRKRLGEDWEKIRERQKKF